MLYISPQQDFLWKMGRFSVSSFFLLSFNSRGSPVPTLGAPTFGVPTLCALCSKVSIWLFLILRLNLSKNLERRVKKWSCCMLLWPPLATCLLARSLLLPATFVWTGELPTCAAGESDKQTRDFFWLNHWSGWLSDKKLMADPDLPDLTGGLQGHSISDTKSKSSSYPDDLIIDLVSISSLVWSQISPFFVILIWSEIWLVGGDEKIGASLARAPARRWLQPRKSFFCCKMQFPSGFRYGNTVKETNIRHKKIYGIFLKSFTTRTYSSGMHIIYLIPQRVGTV